MAPIAPLVPVGTPVGAVAPVGAVDPIAPSARLAQPASASPALDQPPDARGGATPGIAMGVMTWQGNAATAQVEATNNTGAPTSAFDLACEFVGLGQVLGTDRQRVPALSPGGRATVTVTADVGGQLVDRILCSGG
jgi:hypothetical protein